jgi:hypothetical protein
VRPFRAPSAPDDLSAAGESANGASPNGGAPSSGFQPKGLYESISSLKTTRPEITVATAFVGGIALAIFVRRLGR